MESYYDNDLVNDFIKNDIGKNEKNNPEKKNPENESKKHKKEKNKNKNKIKYDNNKEEEDSQQKIVKIKLIKKENDYLMEQINHTNNLIKDYKSKCKEQKKRITELRNKINEMNEKKQNNNNNNEKIVENENIFFYNDSIDGQFDFVIEGQTADKNKQYDKQYDKKYKNDYNKNNNSIINDKFNRIETVIFDIDNAIYYQCGICMDSFNDQESVKKLKCGHIYHKECLEQWIQTNNNCQLCYEFI